MDGAHSNIECNANAPETIGLAVICSSHFLLLIHASLVSFRLAYDRHPLHLSKQPTLLCRQMAQT